MPCPHRASLPDDSNAIGLLPPGARVVVAASGGADSTALVCLLARPRVPARRRAGRAGPFQPQRSGARRRTRTSGSAAAWRSGWGCRSSADVATCGRARARAGDVDRGCRTAAPLRVPRRGAERRSAASHVAVGHTRRRPGRDAAAEPAPGRGRAGAWRHAAGARRCRSAVARLLARRAGDLAGARRDRVPRGRVEPRPALLRNRLRHEVMPAFERAFPGAGAALARCGRHGARRCRLPGRTRRRGARRHVARRRGAARRSTWRRSSGCRGRWPAGSRRLALLRRGPGAASSDVEHAERLLDLAAGRRAGRSSLPGLQAELAGAELRPGVRHGRSAVVRTIVPAHPETLFARRCLFQERLLLGDGRVVSSDVRQGRPSRPAGDGGRRPATAVVDAGRAVATWRCATAGPGDRFRPLGLRRPQDAAGLLRGPEGARAASASGSRSSSTATTGSSGWRGTRFPRISA